LPADERRRYLERPSSNTDEALAVNELPEIPGGWSTREIEIAGRTFHVTLPRVPDAFLDDPDVLAENRRSDYMPYWSYLWPASLPMAVAVTRVGWPAGTEIHEIGAGIGFVGLVALAAGHRVTFSDYRQEAVDLALYNARQNGLSATGECIDWNDAPRDRRFPVILGCDLLYELRNHAPILDLLSRMLAPGGVAWLGDAGREKAAPFVTMARAAKWRVELVDENGAPLAEPRVGKFQLVIVTRESE
jgi:predicted nicotinamide N-methyase